MTLEKLTKDYALIRAANEKINAANCHRGNGKIHGYFSTISACNTYVRIGNARKYREARKLFEKSRMELELFAGVQ